MSVVENQERTLVRLLGDIRPHWRTDRALPARIQSLFARNKSFGSRDRRLYRELIYTAVRYLPWIEPLLDSDSDQAVRLIAQLSAESRATSQFRKHFAADPIPGGAAPKAPSAIEGLPEWFKAECPALFEPAEAEAMLRRASLWIRVQSGRPEALVREFSEEGIRSRPSAALPTAIEILDESDITKTSAYEGGAIEIQDLGSQMVLESVGVGPGTKWLDACAGAGGKTLQLATLLGPKGQVDAHDIRAAALEELQRRATRAGFRIPCELKTGYDGVLVDAPCSGSGTWRRSPHLKWTTRPADVAAAARTQLGLLETFSARVAPGGLLVYATCSLSHRENDDVVAEFLANHPEFQPKPPANSFGFAPAALGLTILPARHNSDGFFVATMTRR